MFCFYSFVYFVVCPFRRCLYVMWSPIWLRLILLLVSLNGWLPRKVQFNRHRHIDKHTKNNFRFFFFFSICSSLIIMFSRLFVITAVISNENIKGKNEEEQEDIYFWFSLCSLYSFSIRFVLFLFSSSSFASIFRSLEYVKLTRKTQLNLCFYLWESTDSLPLIFNTLNLSDAFVPFSTHSKRK